MSAARDPNRIGKRLAIVIEVDDDAALAVVQRFRNHLRGIVRDTMAKELPYGHLEVFTAAVRPDFHAPYTGTWTLADRNDRPERPSEKVMRLLDEQRKAGTDV